MTPRNVLAISALALAGAGGLAWGAQADPGMGGVVQETPGAGMNGITVPQAKLVKAVEGWRAARAEVRALRREVRTLRASLHDRDAYRAEGNRYRAEFMCIAGHESGRRWSVSTGNGYYGGLQMDRDFQRTYGPELYFRKGTADHWTDDEQIAVASRAVPRRGFHPWPNTARMCGLL